MLGESHDLTEEFPEFKDRINDLKGCDHRFARLFDRYNDVNRQVIRAETFEEVVSDDRLEDLKKMRLHLKDDIYALLKNRGAP